MSIVRATVFQDLLDFNAGIYTKAMFDEEYRDVSFVYKEYLCWVGLAYDGRQYLKRVVTFGTKHADSTYWIYDHLLPCRVEELQQICTLAKLWFKTKPDAVSLVDFINGAFVNKD